MSETSRGPGWWQASDGKWYPAEQHPEYQRPQWAPATPPSSATPAAQSAAPAPAPAPAPSGASTPLGPGWWRASDGLWYPPQPGYPPPGYSPQGYPPQGFPPQAGPKGPIYKRVWFWILVVVALGIGGCVTIVSVAGVAVNHAAHVNHTVVYSVTGTGQASDITYATVQEGNGQNGTAQVTNVSLPWSKTITASGLFTVFEVSATVGEGGGTLACTITEDGNQIAHNSASGAFASADCNSAGTP